MPTEKTVTGAVGSLQSGGDYYGKHTPPRRFPATKATTPLPIEGFHPSRFSTQHPQPSVGWAIFRLPGPEADPSGSRPETKSVETVSTRTILPILGLSAIPFFSQATSPPFDPEASHG